MGSPVRAYPRLPVSTSTSAASRRSASSCTRCVCKVQLAASSSARCKCASQATSSKTHTMGMAITAAPLRRSGRLRQPRSADSRIEAGMGGLKLNMQIAKRLQHRGIEVRGKSAAIAVEDHVAGVVVAVGWLIYAAAAQSIVSIGDRQNARPDGDGVTTQIARIAAAIPALVMAERDFARHLQQRRARTL